MKQGGVCSLAFSGRQNEWPHLISATSTADLDMILFSHLETPEVATPVAIHIHELRRVSVHSPEPGLTADQFSHSLQVQPGKFILLSIIPSSIPHGCRSILSIAVSQACGLVVWRIASSWLRGCPCLDFSVFALPKPVQKLGVPGVKVIGSHTCFLEVSNDVFNHVADAKLFLGRKDLKRPCLRNG